jgi:hypothetical protein
MRQFAFILALLVTLELPESGRADDFGTIYRSGDFKRTDAEITDCTGHKLVRRHPELDYYSASTDHGILSGPISGSGFVWMILAKSTGSRSSHADLYNKTAKPAALAEVWQAIEECANQ